VQAKSLTIFSTLNITLFTNFHTQNQSPTAKILPLENVCKVFTFFLLREFSPQAAAFAALREESLPTQ
jgi:hypothetical protein